MKRRLLPTNIKANEFDSELHELITSDCDGHLFVQLCSLSIFTFRNTIPLASISTDGLELPQVYVYQDGYLANKEIGAVSPVVSINGVDVTKYLKEYVSTQALQDPNGQYVYTPTPGECKFG